MTTEEFLTRLENVKQVAPDRWMAKCPSHDDKTASLSIRAAEDGRTLCNDFGEHCSIGEICAAVGLRVTDLMPPYPRDRPYMRPEERGTNVTRATAGDLLELLDYSSGVIFMCALALLRGGREITDADWTDLVKARKTISEARALLRPARLSKRKTHGNQKPVSKE